MQTVFFRLAIFALTTFLPNLVISQDFDNYTPLKCSGAIPNGFLTDFQEVFEAEKGNITASNEADRIATEEFLYFSSYTYQNIKRSGTILFNDPISKYMNRIKDYLLRDAPELKDKIQVFALRSAQVNAFTYADGTIVVGMGLISRLDNEAELACVLAHEIQHYSEKHGISSHLRTQRMFKNADSAFRAMSLEDKIENVVNYSRDQETEADMGGFALIQESAYDPGAFVTVLEKLKFGYLPYDLKPFSPEFFSIPGFDWPESYQLKKVTPIEEKEPYDSLFSTHPKTDDRIDMAEVWVHNAERKGGIPYLFGAEEFENIREIARFEMVYDYLAYRRYERAIYTSFLLLKTHPNSFYLKKIIAHSLYGLARYKNEGDFDLVHFDSEDVTGESQALYHFMDQLGEAELTALALHWVWETQKQVEEDLELSGMAFDLMKDVQSHYNSYLQPDEEEKENLREKSKSFEEEGDKEEVRDKVNFAPGIFSSLISDSSFVKYKNWVFDLIIEEDEEIFKKGRLNRIDQKTKEKGIALGAQKVLIVTPRFVEFKLARKKVGVDFSNQDLFLEMVKECAGKSGLEYDILDYSGDEKTKGEDLESIFLLKTWYQDYLFNYEYDLVGLYDNEFSALFPDNKYSHVVFMNSASVLGLKDKSETRLGVYYIATCFAFPAGIYLLLKKHNFRFIKTTVIDMEEGNIAWNSFETIKSKNRSILRGKLYDLFFQINSNPK